MVFTDGLGRPLTRGGLHTTWGKAREYVGLPDFRFHKLGHTGNTLAAATGVSTKELMARMGHASLRPALSDQHATADRDQALSRLATRDLTVAEHQGRPGTPLHAQGRACPRATGRWRAQGRELVLSYAGTSAQTGLTFGFRGAGDRDRTGTLSLED